MSRTTAGAVGSPETYRVIEDVWSRSSFATVRRHVRKANQKGITVHEGHAERELAEFYGLHLKTTKKHGMPAQTYRYFQNFWQLLPRDCDVRLLLARRDGRAVAASLFVGFGDCVQYVYGASEPSALPLGANYLVIWEAIRLACARGYRRFTLGKTSRENQGLLRFKRWWGADEIPLTYYYHPAVDGTTSSAYTERSLKYHIVTGLWRALPAPVTDRVGGLLYGHLA